ncbi:MAG: DUF445 domain-containing protein [Candidatus Tectomicrobia bacterium]|nr:DUF445 domain-containing protein [Candidatus Tectomicrobia bacterium]
MIATSSPATSWFNKSLGTNLIAAACVIVALILPEPLRRPVFRIGLFALSGAITNWLAIHMLFEKIPGLYGSGVIPARFEDFKREIHRLVMEQFFSPENFERFLSKREADGQDSGFNLAPIIEQADLSPTYDGLVTAVEESSFGNLLNMVGGTTALEPLREPLIAKMKSVLKELSQEPAFQEIVRAQLASGESQPALQAKVDVMVQQRLAELTPQMVKDIMQQMIRDHLGWLVVWGGVFGGLIGLVTTLMPFF